MAAAARTQRGGALPPVAAAGGSSNNKGATAGAAGGSGGGKGGGGQQSSAQQKAHSAGGSSGEDSHPTTPLVLLVMWIISTVGYLVGYVAGPNVADSPAFRVRILHMDPQAEYELRMGDTNPGHQYCFSNTERITVLLAVKYLTGCLSSLPAGFVMRVRGRRVAIWLGCLLFVAAHTVRGASMSWGMFLAGQVLDGISSAFLYQSPYIEGVEIAPQGGRGAFVYMEQFGRSIGVWSRTLLQEGLAMQPTSPDWGWRLAILFPLWPALVALLLVPLLPETPNSLMQRGQLAAARAALQEIRGPLVSVEDEFQGILEAAGVKDGQNSSPFAQLRALLQVQQLPPLLLLMVLTVVREFTGGDFILLFDGPLTAGLGLTGARGSFAFDQAINASYFVAAVLGVILADGWGRRPILIASSVGAGSCFAALGFVLAAADGHPGVMPRSLASLVQVCVIGAYASYAFGWAGGYWLLVAESFPLATRSLATSLFVAATMFMYTVSSKFALSWTCRLRYASFWLYSGMNAAALVIVVLLLPETRNVPLEDVVLQYKAHWFWRRWYRHARKSGSGKHPPPGKPRAAKQLAKGSKGSSSRGPSVARSRAPPRPSSVAAAAAAAAADDYGATVPVGQAQHGSSTSTSAAAAAARRPFGSLLASSAASALGLTRPRSIRQQQQPQQQAAPEQQQAAAPPESPEQQRWGPPLAERGSHGPGTVSASLNLAGFAYNFAYGSGALPPSWGSGEQQPPPE